MKLGVLFSGGKDSTYALKLAMEKEDVACLISILSKNKESYMFHTPNIDITRLQAEAIGLPLVEKTTKGEKEAELAELKAAIIEAKEKYEIEGVVTGAVESVYQAERVERICDELGLFCFSPLWKKDQESLLREIVAARFEVMISGVFAYPMTEKWLGRKIDSAAIDDLLALNKKYKISPTGEGGEIETTVIYAPFFKKRIIIKKSETHFDGSSGTFVIQKAGLKEEKEEKKADKKKLKQTRQTSNENTRRSTKAEKAILVIDLNREKDSLATSEFVAPIVRALETQTKTACTVRHHSELSKKDIAAADKIILSGVPRMDDDFKNYLEMFGWLKDCKKPVLGICAGMQLIGIIFGGRLSDCKEIGMVKIKTTKENPLFSGEFSAYALHGKKIGLPPRFEMLAISAGCIQAFRHKEMPIYGVLFHPEVRNTEIIEKFASIN